MLANAPEFLMRWSGWFGPAALVLAVVSVALAASAAWNGSNARISWTGLVRWIGSAAWAVPAVVVLGIVLHQSTASWTFGKQRAPGPQRKSEPFEPEVPSVVGENAPSSDIAAAERTAPVSAAPVSSDPPQWTATERRTEGAAEFVVVTSGQFATQEEADADTLAQAEHLVRADFERRHGSFGEWNIPEMFLRDRVVRRRHVEQFVRGSTESPFLVRRVQAEVELSPAVCDALRPTWRRQIVAPRLWSLGTVAALLALASGATAGYLRLDALTDGKYRRRLKAAATGLIVSGGLLAVLALA